MTLLFKPGKVLLKADKAEVSPGSAAGSPGSLVHQPHANVTQAGAGRVTWTVSQAPAAKGRPESCCFVCQGKAAAREDQSAALSHRSASLCLIVPPACCCSILALAFSHKRTRWSDSHGQQGHQLGPQKDPPTARANRCCRPHQAGLCFNVRTTFARCPPKLPELTPTLVFLRHFSETKALLLMVILKHQAENRALFC